jgi:hypothetical protein
MLMVQLSSLSPSWRQEEQSQASPGAVILPFSFLEAGGAVSRFSRYVHGEVIPPFSVLEAGGAVSRFSRYVHGEVIQPFSVLEAGGAILHFLLGGVFFLSSRPPTSFKMRIISMTLKFVMTAVVLTLYPLFIQRVPTVLY